MVERLDLMFRIQFLLIPSNPLLSLAHGCLSASLLIQEFVRLFKLQDVRMPQHRREMHIASGLIIHVSPRAGALLHAAEAAHNSEPQHMLQHAPQEAIVQAPPAMAPPQPAAPLDLQTCLQQILHGQMVSVLTCRPSQQHLAV